MNSISRNRFSLLVHAALASTILFVPKPGLTALTPITVNGDSSTLSPATGYDFQADNITFKMIDGDNIGTSGGVSVDNTPNKLNSNLTFNGSTVVQGTIGPTNPIDTLTLAGGSLSTVTFQDDVIISDVLNITNDGTASFVDNATLTGSVDNKAGVDGKGTLIFQGNSILAGSIGATNSLKKIIVNSTSVAGANVILASPTIKATEINVKGTTTTLQLNDAVMQLVGNITTDTNNTNILDVFNATSITGDIGTNTTGFNQLLVGANNDLTVDGNITASTITIQNNKQLTLGADKTIIGNVVSAAPNTGTLLLAGNATVNGLLGTGLSPLSQVIMNGANAIVTLNGNTFTQNGVVFDSGATATSTLNIADNVNVTGNIDNNTPGPNIGTLQFAGASTVTGSVGSTQALNAINFQGNSKTVNITGDVDAATITFNGTTTANIDGDITGNVNFKADGTLIVADTKTILGTVDNTAGGQIGSLIFEGGATVTGTVGATNALKAITLQGASPQFVEFLQDVNAKTTTIQSTAKAQFDGNLMGDVLFNGDGQVTIADTKTLTGNVDASSANIGTLTLEGQNTVTGNIGATNSIKLLEINEQSINPNNIVTLTGAIVKSKDIKVFDDGATATTLLLNNAAMVVTTDDINNETASLNILDVENAATINGNIGSPTPFKLVKVGKNADLTVNGNIGADTTQFQANNTLNLTDNSNIFGDVTTVADTTGKLSLQGNHTITGQVGAPGLALNTISSNGVGTVTFNSKVYSTLYNVNAPSTTNFEDDVTTQVSFTQDGTITLEDNKTLSGSIDNISGTPNIGTLEFIGSGAVTGNIGQSNPIKHVEVNSGGTATETATLNGAIINAQSTNINDDGATATTLLLNNPAMVFTGDITATTANLDVLNIFNATTLNSNIGTAGTPLALIKVAQNVDTTINGNIFATTTQFQGNKTLSLGDNSVVTGNIDSTAANQGILKLLGNATVTGTIGNANTLNTINLVGPNATVNLQGNVKVGTGNLNFAPGATQSTTLNLADGVTVFGNIDNTTGSDFMGVLQFLGNGGVTGKIGNVTGPNQNLFAVNLLGGAGKSVTLGDVHTGSINILDVGTLTLTDDTATDINFSKDGVVNLADNKTLTGNVNNISGTPNVGTFNFIGTGTVTGDMGLSNPLKMIGVNTGLGALETVTLNGTTISAQTIAINDPGTKTTLVLDNPNMKLTGDITAQTNNVDELNILNAKSLTGNIGAAGKALNLIKVAQNVNTTITGDIFATLTEFQGNNTLFLGDGSDVTGAIDSTAPDTGTLTFLGNGSVSSTIGAANSLFAINVQGGAGTTVNLQDDIFVGPGDINFAGPAQTNTTLLLGDGVIVTGNIDNTTGISDIGTLQFAGDGIVTGTIGVVTDSLYAINITGGAGKTVVFQDDVTVSAGNINFAPGATPTTELDIADGVTVDASIDNTTGVNGNGTIEFLGDGSVLGPIGETNKLNLVNLNGGPGKVVNFVNSVNANAINFTADGAATFSDDFTLLAPVTTTANNQGTITFLGDASIQQQIGNAGLSLKAVNFNGVGSTVVLNNDIFALNTNLNAGTLDSDGDQTITGNFNVNNGSTLHIDPDTTPLSVVGNFNLNAGGTLNINLNTQVANAGFVQATKAFIDPAANLIVTNAPAVIAEGVHKFVVVDGGPGSVINELPVAGDSLLLTFKTVADNLNNDLLLEIDVGAVSDFANQSNTIGIAGALDQIINGPPVTGTLFDIINALSEFQDAETLNRDLAALAPIVDGAVFYELVNAQLLAFNATRERLRNVRNARVLNMTPRVLSGFSSGDCFNGRGTWAKLYGRVADQDERQAVAGYQNHMWGFSIGQDVMLTDSTLIGAAFSFTDLDIDHAVSDSQTNAKSYQLGIYGSYDWCRNWFVNWEGMFAYNDYHTQRSFQFASLHFSPDADYTGYMFGAKAEAGYEYVYNCLHVIPLITLFYSHLDLGSYTENGMGNANQFVDSTEFDLFRGGLGVRLAGDIVYQKNRAVIVLQPEMHVNAFYDFADSRMDVTSQFVGAGPSFVTSGFKPERDLYNFGLGLTTFGKDSNLIFTITYDLEWKSDYIAHNGFVRARYEW